MEVIGPNVLELPELGIIGFYGYANAHDFQLPVAAYEEDYGTQWEVVAKYTGKYSVSTRTALPSISSATI